MMPLARRRCWCIVAGAVIAFAVTMPASASHGDHVVIAEVQIGGVSTKDEFVELYNPTAAAVPLEGWRLSRRTASGAESNLVATFPVVSIPAHGSVLIAHPEGAFASVADIRYSTSESLAVDNTLVLYDVATVGGERSVVDLVGWGTATSREGAAAENPASGQSLERLPGGTEGNGQDHGDNATDVRLQSQPTPQGVTAGVRPPIVADVGGGTVVTPPPEPPHIRMNEFVPDPVDGEEWIELINLGAAPTDLAGWTIEDGAGARTVLSGVVGIDAQRFFVVRHPKGALNNDGDRIVLRDARAVLVDAVTYGAWGAAATTSTHAPNASDGAAVARRVDGADTDDDYADFVRTATPTPGAPNVIPVAPTSTERADATATSDAVASVVLNELLPDPVGDDRAEVIELRNLGSLSVDISGWRLRDTLGSEYTMRVQDGETKIQPNSVLVLPRARTQIVLDNDGDTVRLYRPENDRAVSVAEYTDAPLGVSWARTEGGKWSWTTAPTFGNANVIAPPNRAPVAVWVAPAHVSTGAIVTFDASDTADPDGDLLTYHWDFGDLRTMSDVSTDPVAVYVYVAPGIATATLTVRDARGASVTRQQQIVVGDGRAAASIDTGLVTSAPSSVRIIGFLPNPVGSEQGEWLDLANTGDAPVSLRNWTIAITASANITTTGTRLPDRTIASHETLRLGHADLRSWLRNTGGTIVLRASDGTLVDTVQYPRASEGVWYARTSAGWEWVSDRGGDADDADAPPPAARSSAAPHAPTPVESLDMLRTITPGTVVMVRGTVSAPIGVLGAGVLAITDAESGITVYVGRRAIPTLAMGDAVEVTGELRQANGDLRVGIRHASDMRVVGRGHLPAPLELRAQEVGEDHLGSVVRVRGSVVAVRGRMVVIDDGTSEVAIATPESADAVLCDVVGGDTMAAVGILQRTTGGFRVAVRSTSDLVITKAPVSTSSTVPTPVRPSVELALLVAGAFLLVISSLWRHRRAARVAWISAWSAIVQALRR